MNELDDRNPYTADPYEEVEEETEGGERRRKGPGLLLGLLLGMPMGIVFFCLFGTLLINTWSKYTGRYLILGQKQNTTYDSQVLDEETVDKIKELSAYIDYYYNDEYEVADLQESMLHAVVEGLGDPYSVYYTKAEYDELTIDTTGEYYGIGAGLTQDTTTMVVTVSKVYSGTPAEEAGLMKGDIIYTVDGTEATSMELSKLVQMIRGQEGTKVHLQIGRGDEILEFDVERRNIQLPSVEGEMLEGGMGYIMVSEFQTNTAEQFKELTENLKKEGMKGLIVDLRGNPGGMLTTVVDMLDYVLPEGLLVYVEDNLGNRQDFKSDAACLELPMVVLVDGGSASASEIFAGAMKDYAYATLVGTKTFGKGIVQTVFPLEDGDAVKLTTAKYYTPKGNYIHGVGITPDVELEYEFLGPEDAVYEKQYDNQLIRAKEILQEKMK